MLSSRVWLPIGLLLMGVRDSFSGAVHGHKDGAKYQGRPDYVVTTETVPVYYTDVSTATVMKTIVVPSLTTKTVPTTVMSPTTEYVTCTETVPTTVTKYVTTTVISTSTLTVTTPTTSVVYTTETIPTTTVITETFTTFPPRTSHTTTTVYDPCPSSCSLFAPTVNLIYWPTNKPYTYPATYYDPTRDYTFTSPSVYMLIPTMYGTNSLGKVGPQASSTIWPFDLEDVSTFILPEETALRQLTLNDLGTNCPQSLAQDVIATKAPESACDPVLAAPSEIRSWAWPCNACGPFGLFDPPYAIPTLPGGLLGTTTVSTSTGPVPPTTPASTPKPTPEPTTPAPTTPATPTSDSSTSDDASISDSSPGSSAPPEVPTAAATRLYSGALWCNLGLIAFLFVFA